MAKRDIELDEIEVDVDQPAPLSKKQKRLAKKGKPLDAPKIVPQSSSDEEESEASDSETKPSKKPVGRKYGVWVGNLPFSVKPEDLRSFIAENVTGVEDIATSITRVNHVAKRGFAYVDVKTEEDMNAIIALSETEFKGRKVLIKDSLSFEGRPAKSEIESKNPPSRILFVGNLSFDTTDQELEQLFQHCGTISRIRTATFQDTGKCKGFTFIDFQSEESATKALKDKRCRKLNGRTLRMEYGEDRSQRRPKSHSGASSESGAGTDPVPAADSQTVSEKPEQRSRAPFDKSRERRPKRIGTARPAPSVALMNAQRAKQGVVESTGRKLKFD